MNIRICISLAAAVLLGACTDHAAGQKDHVALKNNKDSVSYAIGTDIGHNIRASGLDSLNMDALVMGMRDGADSTEQITSDKIKDVKQRFMIEAQKKAMAAQQHKDEENMRKGEAWLTENGKRQGVTTTASGLQYEVITMGTGPKPTAKDTVIVKFRGTLTDGKQFDTSDNYGGSIRFGLDEVIPGWGEALQLMPAGSKWKVFVPSNLGYGAQAKGDRIPAYSVLVFEMELVSIVGRK